MPYRTDLELGATNALGQRTDAREVCILTKGIYGWCDLHELHHAEDELRTDADEGPEILDVDDVAEVLRRAEQLSREAWAK